MFLSLLKTDTKWIVQTIQLTYENKKVKGTIHSTQSVGPSWALFNEINNGFSQKEHLISICFPSVCKQPLHFWASWLFCPSKNSSHEMSVSCLKIYKERKKYCFNYMELHFHWSITGVLPWSTIELVNYHTSSAARL